MKNFVCLLVIGFLLSHISGMCQINLDPDFPGPATRPYTDKPVYNNPDNFQFAIVSDRTGGHRPGVFGKALQKLNLLNPEFVVSVGDLIEGYSEDTTEIYRQWAEFDSILNYLDVRFYAIPGNHDISNNLMRDIWEERYNKRYYHFYYKNVLFLMLDSSEGNDVMLSNEQQLYLEKILKRNPDVRWTMIFMHHPMWRYENASKDFAPIEELLENRNYTVVAGHVHRYMKHTRNNNNYFTLATTGGGSRLKGPGTGQFDHVTWVTMTDEGPEFAHLQLDGIMSENVVNDENIALSKALIEATQFQSVVLNGEDGKKYSFVNIENSAYQPLFFSARSYHHHQLILNTDHQIEKVIEANNSATFAFTFDAHELEPELIDPFELDYSIRFETDGFDPPFQIEGIFAMEFEEGPRYLIFTDSDIFEEEHLVKILHPFDGLKVRFTTDGSEPNNKSELYTEPIKINSTTTIKARYFTENGTANSQVKEKTYRKVQPAIGLSIDPEHLARGLIYKTYAYEGKKLPDFDTLTALDSGKSRHFNLMSYRKSKDHYALLFEGYLSVPETGIYTFYTRSDDGTRLYLHGDLVVDNDGSHSARTRYGYYALEKGLHPIRIEYFEDYAGEVLEVGYGKHKDEIQSVDFDNFFHLSGKK